MPLRLRVIFSLIFGTFGFIADWAGYDRFNVDLFVPKAFAAVWWHFPLWVAAVFVLLTMYRTSVE